ncbi:MAG: fibronectin type III domain-containing protein [Balneolaceae bacterium]|nr:fibronectin type III domain-containing protein [Balneolaceae bacterium]
MKMKCYFLSLFLILTLIAVGCEQPTTFERDNPNDYKAENFNPDQPLSLDVQVVSDSMVDLQWTHQNSDSVRFEIQVSVDNGPYSQFAVTDAGVSEFSGTLPMELDSEYRFRIAGIKDEIKSSYVEAESFVFDVNPPANLSVGGPDINEAHISWSSGNEFDTNYIVEVRHNSTDPFMTAAEGIAGLEFILANPDPSGNTEVRVAAQTQRHRSEFKQISVVYEQRPRLIRTVENNFSRDADYLMNSGTRVIVKGDGNSHSFVNSSSTMEHLVKSLTFNHEITLYDENNNLILAFDAYPDLDGSPPAVPPEVLVSSKWNQIIVKYFNDIHIRDFGGNLILQSGSIGYLRDIAITSDENFLIAQYTTSEGLSGERDRKFRIWSLPDFTEVSDYHFVREEAPGIPTLEGFTVSPDRRYLAAISNIEKGIYLFRLDNEMNLFDEQFIDLEIENSPRSIIFSYDSRFIFLEYYSPNIDENIIEMDLQNSISFRKLRVGNNAHIGKLKTFDEGPYFLAVHTDISEYSYDFYWFEKLNGIGGSVVKSSGL